MRKSCSSEEKQSTLTKPNPVTSPLNYNYGRGVFLVATAAILWSTGGALIKASTLDPFQVAFWRSLFAFITLVIIVRPRKLSWEWSNGAASLAYALTLITFIVGTKLTTAANAIFLQYTAPLYIVGFSYFLFREKFRKGEMVALLFCIIGIVLFFSDRVDLTGYTGMIWSLVSGVTYACFIIFSKRRTRGHYAEPVMIASFLSVVLSGLLILAGDSGLKNGFTLGLRDLALMGFLGVFQIGLACFLYMRGLRAVSSLEAGIITMLEPICNPIWAFLLIHEVPSLHTMAGGGVIILAVFIHTWQTYSHNRKKHSKTKF